MDVKANALDNPERVLASLTPETLDKLADLIVAKLTTANGGVLLPKQDVVGSNPITRSTSKKTSVLFLIYLLKNCSQYYRQSHEAEFLKEHARFVAETDKVRYSNSQLTTPRTT